MSNYQKLKLLLWKNCLLQRRHKYQTIFEILSPVIFSMFLILIRCLVSPSEQPAKTYEPFMPTYFNMSSVNLGNLTTTRKGTLAFSPENPLTRSVTIEAIRKVAEDNLSFLAFFFNPSMLPTPVGYANAKTMEQALTLPNAMSEVLVGIQFDDKMATATSWPDDIVVTLRFPAVMRTPMVEHPIRASWRTNLLFPIFTKPGPREPLDKYGGKMPGYSPEMFLAVQHAISQGIIEKKTGKSVDTKVYLQRYPQLPYREDILLVALERFISMIIMLCFAYTFVNTVRVVTSEKELQLKETMTIMGLPSWLHWLAWFIKQFSFLLISVVLMVILFKIPFKRLSSGDGYSVLTFTPWSVLLFFMVLFIIASLAFSFMVSVFFNKANTAASFMGLIWFCTYSVFMLTQSIYEDISLTTKLVLSLLSNTAMGYAFQMIIMSEGTGRGLQWDELCSPVSYHDSFLPIHAALMLILDAILYMLIALYVEKIRPGLYGVPLPWYFPFTKSFWASNKSKVAAVTRNHGNDGKEHNDALLKVVHDEEPTGVPIGVNIKNLTKIYKGNRKAVDNLTLRMYENEITVLLGHNGAGKTTTISMLTGMIPPTSGQATIGGYNIVTETELARKSIGICPQHNVLFPDLTVAEHIRFYSKLKGVSDESIQEEVDHFVRLLKLEEKRNALSANLSGGQKRRLSVGAAMCGSSRVVLLDEPTSGIDPAARRALWDLLQREKKGRTMILTTHFMDEADFLGDRVAIMSGGRLQCIGTPYFLKKHYGMGYKLTIVKGENCIVDNVSAFFKTHIGETKENTNIGSELTYILPNEHTKKFPTMLKDLESKKGSLGITSYGLSVTSLEEVFMKAGAEDNSKMMAKRDSRNQNSYKDSAVVPLEGSEGSQPDHIEKVRGRKLLKNHIRAMFLKLAYNSMRSKLIALIQFLSPIINIALSVFISRSWKFISELPPLTLSLTSGFRNTETLISHSGDLVTRSTVNNAMDRYKQYYEITKYPGMKLTDLGTKDIGQHYLQLSAANQAKVRFETLIGATFRPDSITAWFSNYGYHDSAISLANANNAILKALSPSSSLTIVNHPLPYSIENLVQVMAAGGTMGFQFAFNIGFCMAFVTSFLVLFVVKERLSGAKLLQRVSGVRPAVMWLSALVWDCTWMLLIYICIIATLAFFHEKTLSTPAELGRVLLVLIVFSFAIIPIHYVASFYFESAATGFSKMCFLNIFTGCMPFLIAEVLRIPHVGNKFYANLFDWLFSPLPIYCLSRSFRDMSVSSFSMLACDGLCDALHATNCTRKTICQNLNVSVCCIEDDPFFKWSEPGIGRYLFTMSLFGVLTFTFLLLKEYRVFKKSNFKLFNKSNAMGSIPQPSADEDSDVKSERERIRTMTRTEITQKSLVTKDLTKYYKKFLAVKRLTFGVERGECFGLLGINGAGKTSTFRMLTGDTRISYGDAFVHGLSVKTQLQSVYSHIGYCPQFDALFDNLTARETLRIFCLLRGIPKEIGAASSWQLAKELGFAQHFDKKVYQCSGGTKRKISTAIALLGSASLVFLDEPTTGMDPASKRLVWTAVSGAVRSGRSVLLTSHSMEECEALCSRLTVMVGGQLHCLGPLQHLKTKFSQGYTIIAKCKSGPDRDAYVALLQKFIVGKFSSAKLIEMYLGISTYYVHDSSLEWWRLFEVMEQARDKLALEDYSITQTTLEQVFMQFTRIHSKED